MTTKLTGTTPTDLIEGPTATPREAPVDWERAFVLLTALSCTGFVQSELVGKWAQIIHDEVDPRAAKVLVSVFNRTRSKWMQDFMG